MRAMILAAGLGTRLRPLTDTIPKPLLPVGGAPLIAWNMLLLRKHGITDIIVNLHHLGTLIEKALGEGEAYGVRLTYSREERILGTGGGIKQAEWFFNGEPFLVVNADTLHEVNLTALIAQHARHGGPATMVLRDDPDAARWGEVLLDDAQHIVSIGGRGRSASGGLTSRMFAGVHVLHPKLLADVPLGHQTSIIDAYVRALERGETIGGFDYAGYWSDIGTPERLETARRDADAGVIRLADRLASEE
jgi:NDP-sugar pyrophosphorylase family protein